MVKKGGYTGPEQKPNLFNILRNNYDLWTYEHYLESPLFMDEPKMSREDYEIMRLVVRRRRQAEVRSQPGYNPMRPPQAEVRSQPGYNPMRPPQVEINPNSATPAIREELRLERERRENEASQMKESKSNDSTGGFRKKHRKQNKTFKNKKQYKSGKFRKKQRKQNKTFKNKKY